MGWLFCSAVLDASSRVETRARALDVPTGTLGRLLRKAAIITTSAQKRIGVGAPCLSTAMQVLRGELCEIPKKPKARTAIAG